MSGLLRLRGQSKVLRAALLAAVAVTAHLPALWTSFMADDYSLLRAVRRVHGVAWVFTHNDIGQSGSAGHFYRPLWILWHKGIFEAFGTEPAAFHVASLLLFVVICLEVWLLARYFFTEPVAWLAGLAFAAYPRHSEAVVWVAGSTDLLSAVFGIGAVLCLAARRPAGARATGAALLGIAAAFSKETAFILPIVGALVLWARRDDETPSRERWWPLGALIAAQVGALAVRTAVLGGVGGGYAEYPWRPLRVIAAAISDGVATLTPPQLQVLRYPALLIVPLLALGALAWAVGRLWRQRERRRIQLVVLGLGWFAATLAPTLNLTVDLNNANGERYLFMPSVGLMLALAALVGPRIQARRGALVGLALLAGVALSIQNADNWLRAGRLADSVLADAVAIGPKDGELVLLSVPASYRTARVFQVSLDAAVELSGRPDLAVATCLPVQVLNAGDAQVAFTAAGDGSYRGTSTWAAPFDFPVFRNSLSHGQDCTYRRDDGRRWPPGVGLAGLAYPAPTKGGVLIAFFDGRRLRPR